MDDAASIYPPQECMVGQLTHQTIFIKVTGAQKASWHVHRNTSLLKLSAHEEICQYCTWGALYKAQTPINSIHWVHWVFDEKDPKCVTRHELATFSPFE